MPKYRDYEKQLLDEFNEALSFMDSNPITRVTETPAGDVIIPVKAIAFSRNDSEKDLYGDRFSPDVDLGHPAVSTIPAYFDHGKDKAYIAFELVSSGYSVEDAKAIADEIALGKQYIGVGVRSEIDSEALYYNIVVNRRQKYRNLIKRLAEEGHIAPSTAVKFRENAPDDPHLIKMWQANEITLTPTQAEPRLEVVNEKSVKESEMPVEEPKDAVQQAPAAVTEGGGEGEKPTNPLIEQIEKSFAPPAQPEQQTTLSDAMARMDSIEKSVAEILTLVKGNVPQTLLATQQLQEAMPVLVEHVAKALAPGMATLISEANSKSRLEKDVEKGLKPNGTSAQNVRPGYGQFPANAPGGRR